MDWDIGTDTRILLIPCPAETADEILLYSAGRCTQGSVLTSMGRKSRSEGICVHVQLIHFAAQWRLTRYYKGTISQ